MLLTLLIGILIALVTVLPLSWKWQFGVRQMALTTLLFALVSSLLVVLLNKGVALSSAMQAGLVWLGSVAGITILVLYRFYRDPERISPVGDNVIVSPADGTVLYVRRTEGGMLPVANKHGHEYPLRELTKLPLGHEDAVVIGIGMNYLDVHVNRAPMAGRVRLWRHFPGSFGSLRLLPMEFENERVTTVIENGDRQVAVVQIASRLVRQIVSFVHEGEDLRLGQRIGKIRFGSQVDVVLTHPDDLRILVQPGEHLSAGTSMLAEYDVVPTRTEQPVHDGSSSNILEYADASQAHGSKQPADVGVDSPGSKP
jgi:phosphatidylserine decarboxylase